MTQHTTIAADPYWSREKDDWEAVERVDPVVWSDQPGSLNGRQMAAFDRDGYHFAEQLFEANDAVKLLAEAKRLAESADPASPETIVEPQSRAVRSVFRVHRTNEVFRAVCKDPRIIDLVQHILDDEVYVHQSRINFKPAFDGREFFWHSDFETWHIEDGMPRMRAVSVSLNLTENNEFNGPLMVVPGSHRLFIRCVGATPDQHFKQSLRKQEYGVPSREAMQMLVQRGGMAAPKGPPGSALFFECNLMHGSAGNLSPYSRTNLFVVYNSVKNAVVDPFGNRPPRPEFLAERDIVPVSQL
jgi:ectoine hydroxylase